MDNIVGVNMGGLAQRSAEPSVLQVHHGSLDPNELHVVWLLQTGANVTLVTHGSHYSALFPVINIDGKLPSEISLNQLNNMNIEIARSPHCRFHGHGWTETIACQPISGKNVPACTNSNLLKLLLNVSPNPLLLGLAKMQL